MKTAVIYARYSSDRQTEQSIEGQVRVCNDYAERNNILIVNSYIDRATTGTNDNRTEFQRMLRDSNNHSWDYVLVYKLDRFSRNKYEMAMHKKTLKDNGVKLISCMENITDTPEGIILESLLEGMAEYYSAELSQKVKRGMNESRQKGTFTGGFIIFGYRVENKKIIIHEDEAEVVRWMFNECASGKLVKTIIEELHEKGILYRGKPFARNTVYHLLANEKYSGIYRHGEEVFTNMYPRIVPQDIFDAVKSKIDSNKYGKHKPNVVYLLKNKVKCGYCGKPVNSDAGTSKNGSIMRYYKCSGKRVSKQCQLRPIRKETLETLILKSVLEAFETPQNLLKFADDVILLLKKQYHDHSVLNLLRNDLAKVEKSISNLLDCMEQGISTASTKNRLEELEEKRSLLTEKIQMEQYKERRLLTKDEIVKHISNALRKNPKQLIDLLVKEIRLYNDKIEIDLHFTDKKSPDDENHWDFCFYQCEKSYIVDTHVFKSKPKEYRVKIKLKV